MIRKLGFIGFVSALLLCTAALAGLLPCPDCGMQISDRAVMCPACGCPGEAILAAAQSNKTAEIELPAYCHSLISVSSDQGTGVGVCIQGAGQLYVLTPQSLLAGAQSLSLTKVLDGQSVPYSAIELAADRDLVRLVVSSTNLQPLAVASADSADIAVVHIATNNTVVLMRTGEITGPLPAGSPLVDAATNVVLMVTTDGGKHAVGVASVSSWVPAQPLAYRTQTTLLREAAERRGDVTSLLQQLQETEWLTPYLAQQAESLIKSLGQDGSNP